jgi:hypothetical protein
MKKEIKSLVSRIENVNSGEPWFGRSVFAILDDVNPKNANRKPGGSAHSLVELIWHMNTWAGFTLQRIEKNHKLDLVAFEKLDWRKIDPAKHSWKKGVAEFKATHKKIISLLKKKNDAFLEEKVDFRNYNFRFLINGMIEHNIYHLGQIAYLNKLTV